MNTKLTIALLFAAVSAIAQPFIIDYSTPKATNGTTLYGDIFPVPFIKANSNSFWTSNQLVLLKATDAIRSNSILTLSNRVNVVETTNTWISKRVTTNASDITTLFAVVNGLTNALPNTSVGGVGLTNGTVTARRVETTNLWLSTPRWVDALASGLTLAGGTAAPEKAALPGSWTTAAEGYRYGHNDYSSFAIQAWHVMASIQTNPASPAYFPSLFYEPHIHISVADISAGTNATFVLEWQTSIVNGSYTNYNIRTNTYGFTATNTHSILSFGEITNNDLSAMASVIFQGSVKRIASASNDVGSGAAPNQSRKIFITSLDFHIPVRVLGSASQRADE